MQRMEYTKELMETVITFDGIPSSRNNCRFIKGEYYIKGKQCFYINGQWYRINSGKIIFDHETKSWVVIGTRDLLRGIVGMDGDKPVLGDFSPNNNKNTLLYLNKRFNHVMDESILLDDTLFDLGVNGVYYRKGDFNNLPKEFTVKLKPKREGFYSFGYDYGSEPFIPEFRERFNNSFVGNPLKSDAYKYLDNYTFGVEFETEKGAIPEKLLMNSGLIACRDGSISGFEYVTIPLSGEKGIQAIKEHCKLLSKYCSCSVNESMHIHIGGYPKTVKAIASLYRLSLILQKEVYTLFPYFYADTGQFKRKGYCNPMYREFEELTSPGKIFSGIYYYLSNGSNFGGKFPTNNHPMDRSGQHKWEISPRYHWLNLIPLIWGGRKTVEFRCHTPTVSSTKTIYWLFIIIAILKYAKAHINDLTTVSFVNLPVITLGDVILNAYPKKIGRILIDYIKFRKNYYKSKNDPMGEDEIKQESKMDPLENLIL